MTSPPSPPSPPSGPPRGTYFSRRKLQQPRPPSPALTYRVTRSTNIGSGQWSVVSGQWSVVRVSIIISGTILWPLPRGLRFAPALYCQALPSWIDGSELKVNEGLRGARSERGNQDHSDDIGAGPGERGKGKNAAAVVAEAAEGVTECYQ